MSLQELAPRTRAKNARAAAIAARTAILNQRGMIKTTRLATARKRQLRAVDTAIANLDLEINRLIASEIGAVSAKQAAMIAGLAPIACASGARAGARPIRGGRPHLRAALSMAAGAAARFIPTLKPFYDRRIADCKKANAARTAVMRKLVVLENTLGRENRSWKPNHA